MKVKHLRIEEVDSNGNMVHEYIMCTNPHGVLGAYDTVTKNFYPCDMNDFLCGNAEVEA